MSKPVDNEIRGKLALITGASGGIGAACARDLYLQGAHLALTYSSGKDKVEALISSIQSDSTPTSSTSTASTTTTSSPPPKQRISSHQVDMTSTTDLERLFTELSTAHSQPGPDILISNAGYGTRIPSILDIPISEFDKMLTINLRASFILAKFSAAHMIERHWGRIIFMSSIAAYGGGINGCHYAASKAGLLGLTKNLANKLAKDGISVNDVAPAMIGETGMIPDEKFVEGTPGDVKNIPVGRLGTVQEVANVVTMLCRTGYLTGQSILLTGGLK